MRIIIALMGICLIALFAVIGFVGDVTPVETARVRSPDGRVDAVVTTSSAGGAAGSVVTWVFLVPAGAPITSDDNFLVSATHVEPALSITWSQDRVIEISYNRATISIFSDRWIDRRSSSTSPYEVELRLRANVVKAS